MNRQSRFPQKKKDDPRRKAIFGRSNSTSKFDEISSNFANNGKTSLKFREISTDFFDKLQMEYGEEEATIEVESSVVEREEALNKMKGT